MLKIRFHKCSVSQWQGSTNWGWQKSRSLLLEAELKDLSRLETRTTKWKGHRKIHKDHKSTNHMMQSRDRQQENEGSSLQSVGETCAGVCELGPFHHPRCHCARKGPEESYINLKGLKQTQEKPLCRLHTTGARQAITSGLQKESTHHLPVQVPHQSHLHQLAVPAYTSDPRRTGPRKLH